MIIRISGHDFHYECDNLCRVFFPNEKIKISYGSDGEDAKTVETVYDGETVGVNAVIDGLSRGYSESAAPDKAELITARLIFRALSEITGYTPPWGVLTGVRPSKLMLRLISLYGREGAEAYFDFLRETFGDHSLSELIMLHLTNYGIDGDKLARLKEFLLED